MRRLTFGLLGPTVVIGESGPLPLPGALRRRLLTRLLMSANQPIPVDRLREDLWDGHPPPGAATTLKSHVSLLRRSLGPDALSFENGAYVISVPPEDLDVCLFEQEFAAGRAAWREGQARSAADLLGRGLGRWRGPALSDAAGTAWATPEAVRLEEMRAAGLEAWFEARIELGEHVEVVAAAEAAVSEHPLREGLWAKLILALYRSSRQADALRAYQRVRAVLADELGIDPGPELVALEGALLRQEPALLSRPTTDDGRSAGGNQVLPELDPVPNQPNNLPAELSSFIGRELQLTEIDSLLGTSRLVTLTGTGGVGKTRLALRVAQASVAGPGDGIWLAELASATNATEVLRELANATGVREEAGVDLIEAVALHLADGDQLVVLDNCEQVRQAVAALVARLLRAGDSLRILTTSREPLGVPGESVYRVPSMSVPESDDEGDSEQLMGFEAIRLLLERARSQQPNFSLDAANGRAAVSLCRRLDGIPLALELAAARVRSMSLPDIESRLDDRFHLLTMGAETVLPRQRTLRALVDWSYDLLSEPERAVLCRLSVFTGGWDLASAETIAGHDELERWEVVDLLASLVDKSLVQADTSGEAVRYRLLETVRDYGTERLLERGGGEEAEVRGAHAQLFLDLAETAAPHFSGAGQVLWRNRLEADRDNLRAAFMHFLAHPDGATYALRFCTALGWFWSSRGSYGEGIELIQAALERPDAAAPTALRSSALSVGGHLLCRCGDVARAHDFLEEAVAIARKLDDPALTADALRNLAWVEDRRGDHDTAVILATEAVELASNTGRTHLLARAHDVRAAARQQHDPTGARSDYATALRYCESAEDYHGQASTLNNLAVLELEQGNHSVARSHFSRALGVARQAGSMGVLPYLEYGIGLASALEGDFETALGAFTTALRIARHTGQRSLVAYAILGAAISSVEPGQERRAAALHGAAMALFEKLGETPEPLEAGLRDQSLAALRVTLGDELEQQSYAGHALPLPDAIALALAADGDRRGEDKKESTSPGSRDDLPPGRTETVSHGRTR